MNVNEALVKIVNGVENNARDIAEAAKCIHGIIERLDRLEAIALGTEPPLITLDAEDS